MTYPTTILEPLTPPRCGSCSTIRRTRDLHARCWVDPAEPEPVPAQVRTLSSGGLSLSLARWPEPVPYLDIELGNPRRGTARRFRVRVLYALRLAQGCVVGVSFPHKLAAEELNALMS